MCKLLLAVLAAAAGPVAYGDIWAAGWVSAVNSGLGLERAADVEGPRLVFGFGF